MEKNFLQGAGIDGVIEANLEKLARQTALKHALNTSNIGAKAAFMARQDVLEKIENYKDRVQYLSGQRRRLLEILIAQQEKPALVTWFVKNVNIFQNL